MEGQSRPRAPALSATGLSFVRHYSIAQMRRTCRLSATRLPAGSLFTSRGRAAVFLGMASSVSCRTVRLSPES